MRVLNTARRPTPQLGEVAACFAPRQKGLPRRRSPKAICMKLRDKSAIWTMNRDEIMGRRLAEEEAQEAQEDLRKEKRRRLPPNFVEVVFASAGETRLRPGARVPSTATRRALQVRGCVAKGIAAWLRSLYRRVLIPKWWHGFCSTKYFGVVYCEVKGSLLYEVWRKKRRRMICFAGYEPRSVTIPNASQHADWNALLIHFVSRSVSTIIGVFRLARPKDLPPCRSSRANSLEHSQKIGQMVSTPSRKIRTGGEFKRCVWICYREIWLKNPQGSSEISVCCGDVIIDLKTIDCRSLRAIEKIINFTIKLIPSRKLGSENLAALRDPATLLAIESYETCLFRVTVYVRSLINFIYNPKLQHVHARCLRTSAVDHGARRPFRKDQQTANLPT